LHTLKLQKRRVYGRRESNYASMLKQFHDPIIYVEYTKYMFNHMIQKQRYGNLIEHFFKFLILIISCVIIQLFDLVYG